MELLKSRSYVQLLVLAALIGVPVSAVAYFYLALVSHLQTWIYQSLPSDLGFHGTPVWWPVPILLVAGVLVAATITYLPGTVRPRTGQRLPGRRRCTDRRRTAGRRPRLARHPGPRGRARPEAPLIAIGGGLGALAVRLAARNAPRWPPR